MPSPMIAAEALLVLRFRAFEEARKFCVDEVLYTSSLPFSATLIVLEEERHTHRMS